MRIPRVIDHDLDSERKIIPPFWKLIQVLGLHWNAVLGLSR